MHWRQPGNSFYFSDQWRCLKLNKKGTPVAGIAADEEGYGGINISNKDGITVVNISANENGGAIGILNKFGTVVALMGVSEDGDGGIVVLNKQGDMIGRLP